MAIRFLQKLPERRIKRLRIEQDMFLAILKRMDGKRRIRCEGLPDDVRTVGLVVDETWNTVTLYLESPDFPVVPPQYSAENLDLTFTEYSGDVQPLEREPEQ